MSRARRHSTSSVASGSLSRSAAHRRATPRASDPLRRRFARSAACHSSKRWIEITRSAGTRWWSKLTVTVALAFTAARRSGSARRVGPAVASTSAQTMSPSSRRAAARITFTRPHPVTQGANPLKRQPSPSASVVRIGGPGRRSPEKATPARTAPLQSRASQASRSAGRASSTARTAPWCWIQTNAVVRQPEAMISMTSSAVAKSTPMPPACSGPARP